MENIHTEDKYLVSSSKLSDLLLISKYLLNMGYVYLGYSDHVYYRQPRSTYQPIHRSTIDQLLVDSGPTIGR